MRENQGKQSLTKSILKVIAIIATIIALLLGTIYMIMSIDGVGKNDRNDSDDPKKTSEPAGNESEVIDGIYYPPQSDFETDDESGMTYVKNVVMIYFDNGTDKKDVDKCVKAIDGEIVSSDEFIDLYIVKVKGRSLKELEALCKKINKMEHVDVAMVDYGASFSTDKIPDDPWGGFLRKLFRIEWSEDDPEGKNWWLEAIDAPSAWDHNDKLEKITVGLIDVNIDTEHEDLKKVITANYAPASEEDDDGHGSHVAGIIGAAADNGKGITGVLWNCKILASGCKLEDRSIDKDDTCIIVPFSNIEMNASKLIEKGAKVVNASFGFTSFQTTKENVEAQKELWGLHASKPLVELAERDKDFVIVQSAGNGSEDYTSVDASRNGLFCSISEDNCAESKTVPAKDIIDRIIVVGNAEMNGKTKKGKPRFRQEESSNAGPRVDICAPGTNVYSCLWGSKYGNLTGTSMSAPVVTGVAGMVWSADPKLTGAQVKKIVCAKSNTRYKVSDNDSKKHPLTDSYRMVNAKLAVEDALKKAGKLDDDEESGKDTEKAEKAKAEPETPPDYEEDYDYIDNDWSRKVVLVLDASGSMDGEPMYKTRDAARRFVDQMDSIDAEVSIVEYSDYATVLTGFTKDHAVLNAAIDELEPYSQTNIEDGLYSAEQMLREGSADKKIIVLMSDGQPNVGLVDEDLIYYANTIKEEGDIIYTLGFFDYVEDLWYSQYLMEQIATPGNHYEADDPENLRYFFEDLGEQIKGARYMYVRIACPVDVTVTNGKETLSSAAEDYNTRTEFGNLSFESNEYGDDTKVLRLREGNPYDIRISGYDDGYMDYSINLMNDEGEYDDLRSFNVEINNNTVIDTVAERSGKTRLKVDANGDGRYDVTYVAGKNGYGEIEKNYWLPLLIILSVVAILTLVVYKNKRKIMYVTVRKRRPRRK